jgi:hypothetical protein
MAKMFSEVLQKWFYEDTIRMKQTGTIPVITGSDATQTGPQQQQGVEEGDGTGAGRGDEDTVVHYSNSSSGINVTTRVYRAEKQLQFF